MERACRQQLSVAYKLGPHSGASTWPADLTPHFVELDWSAMIHTKDPIGAERRLAGGQL